MSLAKAQQYDKLSRIVRASIQPLQEVHQEPDQHDPFVDEAKNRLEQDVLMASNGIRTRVVLERLKRYKAYMTQLGAEELDVVQKYKDQVLEAAASSTALARYVPGEEIQGDALRSFSMEPKITGPLVCQLCDDTTFAYDADLAAHKDNVHAGENEYRKRVLSWSNPDVGRLLAKRRGL